MAQKAKSDSNQIIEDQLDVKLARLQDLRGSDCLSFIGPIHYGYDDAIRDAVESVRKKRRKLSVILETGGGLIEVAERIADTFRRHYRQVEFIVPDSAMSAGTVLVMSGDAILMDYYSILGPIDPQIERSDSKDLVPAVGYLKEYERLVEKSKRGELTTAELTYLVQRFDPAELYQYKQARELSISLLEQWLEKYKFKNWKVTETRKVKVTRAMRKKRAKEVGEKLSETDTWHSHRRGIPIEVLRRELKLKIQDFGENADLNEGIRSYTGLLMDYAARNSITASVHVVGRFEWLARRR